MIKCDFSLGKSVSSCLFSFGLLCFPAHRVRWKQKNIAAMSMSLSGLPPHNPTRDHKTLTTTFLLWGRREEVTACVNDGSLVIPSHVCSDFGFAYAHRHKSTLHLPPSLPSVLVRSHRADHCCRHSGPWFVLLSCPIFSGKNIFPSIIFFETPALSLLSYPWCGSTKTE